MKDKRTIILILFLIVLYFIVSFINTEKKYIIFSNHLYQIKNNDLKLVDNKIINNKKINLVNRSFDINEEYFKVIEKDNTNSILYSKDNKSINERDYYYGFTGKQDILEFKDDIGLVNDDMDFLNSTIKKNDINLYLDDFNYIKVVSFENDKRIIFAGNFYDNKYYSVNIDKLEEKKYVEFIIYYDSKEYHLVNKTIVDKNHLLDTDFITFNCILKINNNYYLGTNSLNYSFFDGSTSSLYKMSKENIKRIE